MTTVFAPGTLETDPKRQNQALQDHASKIATNTTDIETNTTDIAALQSTVGALPGTIVSSVATSGLATGGPITSTGTVTVTAAAQSDQETATSTTTAVTPGRQQYHPSAAKAWVKFAGSGSNGAQTVNASYNVSGVSRTGTGLYTVSFTTSFSSADYVAIPNGLLSGTVMAIQIAVGSQATGSIGLVFSNSSTGAQVDPGTGYFLAFGDQ